MHVEVKSLTPAVQSALKSVSYGAHDILIVAANEVSAYSEGGKGQRGFTIAVNLDTGERKSMIGSWGGSNMFTSTLVDESREFAELPENGIVIKGQMGWPRTFATIYAHPTTVGAYLLPSGDEEVLTDTEQQAIYCFAAIKGGQYRRDEMRRRRVVESTVDSLVERGYLKRSKNGATQITTKGKNARTINN